MCDAECQAKAQHAVGRRVIRVASAIALFSGPIAGCSKSARVIRPKWVARATSSQAPRSFAERAIAPEHPPPLADAASVTRDSVSDVILDGEDVANLAVIAFGP